MRSSVAESQPKGRKISGALEFVFINEHDAGEMRFATNLCSVYAMFSRILAATVAGSYFLMSPQRAHIIFFFHAVYLVRA